MHLTNCSYETPMAKDSHQEYINTSVTFPCPPEASLSVGDPLRKQVLELPWHFTHHFRSYICLSDKR